MRMTLSVVNDKKVIVQVDLSKRNLLSLLHKLEMEGSARTIWTADNVPDGYILSVRSESDEEHYAGREYGPGIMHPETETFVAAQQDCDACNGTETHKFCRAHDWHKL